MDPVISFPASMPLADVSARDDARSSGVSWGAVVAGAFVIAAASLALLALGAGVGFSAVSPWAHEGASGSAIGWSAIAWLVVMQVVTCSLGGYLAGRLRTRWVSIHGHEVCFRDTAHGLSWASSVVEIFGAFLTPAAAGMVGAAAGAAGSTAGAVSQNADRTGDEYAVDTMLRGGDPTGLQGQRNLGNETARIFANSLTRGELPSAIAPTSPSLSPARRGVSGSKPESAWTMRTPRRGNRGHGAQGRGAFLYWTFLALVVGAFSASLAATFGGKQRDRVAVLNH